ncbi:LysR family transcriptional regulator [Lutibaculum baratangense]|uniref:Transcriptional regulator, LysR family n=1 Tax=Lutibaculum baratangense AMV1 TaxID=631454 RepID=V4R8M2_9HYPH|nr:LysR family transcriptional regulator [Lutibaculum baratangense]ESR22521.1 Transcriptional regulator, LysR family [Lutibaculum baratangense AMV1]
MSTADDPGARLARDLDWNLLRTLIAVVQEGSVTRGAERLRLKQPTVSNALRRLEERLGRRLIDRGPGRFELTEAGRILYREAIEIQGSIHRLGIALRDVGEEISGHVRIFMASHVLSPVFDATLADFHAAHPRATLSIDVTASRLAIEEVLARRASFAVCLVHDKNPTLQYRRLFREFFGLFCGPPHPLFGREGLTRADLEGHSSVSFVTDSLSDALHAVAIMRAEARLDEKVVATSSHLEEVRRMIIAGLGVGPLPLHVASPDVRGGSLWRLPPYTSPPAVDVYVVWHPRATMNRAEQTMLKMLTTRIDSIPIEDRTYS